MRAFLSWKLIIFIHSTNIFTQLTKQQQTKWKNFMHITKFRWLNKTEITPVEITFPSYLSVTSTSWSLLYSEPYGDVLVLGDNAPLSMFSYGLRALMFCWVVWWCDERTWWSDDKSGKTGKGGNGGYVEDFGTIFSISSFVYSSPCSSETFSKFTEFLKVDTETWPAPNRVEAKLQEILVLAAFFLSKSKSRVLSEFKLTSLYAELEISMELDKGSTKLTDFSGIVSFARWVISAFWLERFTVLLLGVEK